MTGPRLLRAATRTPRPWRNGGGITRDIAAVPEQAGDEDFLWRASIATIAAAGPFSTFPGVDRAFLLLRGELAIAVAGAEQRLDRNAAVLRFAGEAEVSAKPIGEPCVALNIMTRRGAVSAALDRWTAPRPPSADVLLLVATETTAIDVDGTAFQLAPDDALLLDPWAKLRAIDGAVIAAGFSV